MSSNDYVDPNAHINPVLRSVRAKAALRQRVDANGYPLEYDRQPEPYRALVSRAQHDGTHDG